MKKRCSFGWRDLVCVLEEEHAVEPIFGGHHLVAERYVESDEPWDDAKCAAFSAQYTEEDT